MSPSAPSRALWSSRLVFVLATTGSAVGLGNIWRFPYIAGENGGSAFILVYIACVILIGIPILIAETLLGRCGGANPVHSLAILAKRFGFAHYWKIIGWLALSGSFAILSYYSVIAGWTMAYMFRSVAGLFDQITVDGSREIFNLLVRDSEKLIAWHTLFILITAGVVGAGVNEGIERIVKWFIPLLFLILLLLLSYVFFESDIGGGLAFMFTFNAEQLTINSVLAAMGQAFLSLGVGIGAIMVYGSYLPGNVSIAKTAAQVASLDTLVALIAGIIIFSLVAEFALDPAAGPGLVFQVLPLAFGQITGGWVLGTVFYFLLMVAAWTSAVSLLEPGVAWLSESFSITRTRATVIITSLAWSLGLITVFSFSLPELMSVGDRTLFDWLDFLAVNFVLPIGGISIIFFTAWKMPAAFVRTEIGIQTELLRCLMFWTMRYIAPVGALMILIYQLHSSM